MSNFAKELTHPEYGQLIAMLDVHDENDCPVVRIYCKPEGLGVCKGALIFNNSEEGAAQAQKTLEEMTAETAGSIVKTAFDISEEIS